VIIDNVCNDQGLSNVLELLMKFTPDNRSFQIIDILIEELKEEVKLNRFQI
jgi:hypothetical protein